MNLVYCINGFYRAAGMERVLADKANWLVAHGHAVTILTSDQQGRPDAFPLDPRIAKEDLAIGYERNNGASLLNKLLHYPYKQFRHRRRLEAKLAEIRPDITLSMFCNEVNLLPRLKDGSRKILEIHFSRFKRLQYGRHGLWALLDRFRSRNDLRLAARYDRFVVLTEEDKGYWEGLSNLCVIPNPLPFCSAAPNDLEAKTVLAAGRYSYQKGYDRLLTAWKQVCDWLGPGHGWQLRLAGDGELREALAAQAQRLGICGSVVLGSVEHDMEALYRQASILAMSSRYEGLPMVLLEASAFGIPAVCFDFKCGPKDVITPGENGLIVPDGDIDAFADALLQLMQNPEQRKAMGRAAYTRAGRWQRDKILKQWTDLFEETLSSRP